MMQRIGSVLRSVSALLACFTLAACGGGKSAESPGRDALTTDLEQRAAELESEAARLEGHAQQAKQPEGGAGAGEGGLGAVGIPEQGPPAPPPDTASAAAPSEPAAAAPVEDEQKEESPRERCRTACRALDSMQRSSERICSLVGDSHEKCTWARSQVKDARERVEAAGCDCSR